MKKLLMLVMLLGVVLLIGCNPEEVAEQTADGAAIARPWLPSPFKEIAMAVQGVALLVAGAIAKRKSTRATTAELQKKAEARAKESLADSIRTMGDLIDALRSDSESKVETEKFLERFREARNGLESWKKSSLNLFNSVRKGLDVMNPGTYWDSNKKEDIILPAVSLES